MNNTKLTKKSSRIKEDIQAQCSHQRNNPPDYTYKKKGAEAETEDRETNYKLVARGDPQLIYEPDNSIFLCDDNKRKHKRAKEEGG